MYPLHIVPPRFPFVQLTGSGISISALAGATQRAERWPENQRVSGSVPGRGTCLGCRPGPQQRGHREGQLHIDVSLFRSPSLKIYK